MLQGVAHLRYRRCAIASALSPPSNHLRENTRNSFATAVRLCCDSLGRYPHFELWRCKRLIRRCGDALDRPIAPDSRLGLSTAKCGNRIRVATLWLQTL